MFFNNILVENKVLNKVWRAGFDCENNLEDSVAVFPEICKNLDTLIDSEHQDPRKRLSLRTSSILIDGAARLLRKDTDRLIDDMFELESKMITRKRKLSETDSEYDSSTESSVRTPEKILRRSSRLANLTLSKEKPSKYDRKSLKSPQLKYSYSYCSDSSESESVNERNLESSTDQTFIIPEKSNIGSNIEPNEQSHSSSGSSVGSNVGANVNPNNQNHSSNESNDGANVNVDVKTMNIGPNSTSSSSPNGSNIGSNIGTNISPKEPTITSNSETNSSKTNNSNESQNKTNQSKSSKDTDSNKTIQTQENRNENNNKTQKTRTTDSINYKTCSDTDRNNDSDQADNDIHNKRISDIENRSATSEALSPKTGGENNSKTKHRHRNNVNQSCNSDNNDNVSIIINTKAIKITNRKAKSMPTEKEKCSQKYVESKRLKRKIKHSKLRKDHCCQTSLPSVIPFTPHTSEGESDIDSPFGYFIIHDSYKSRVPSKLIMCSLNDKFKCI